MLPRHLHDPLSTLRLSPLVMTTGSQEPGVVSERDLHAHINVQATQSLWPTSMWSVPKPKFNNIKWFLQFYFIGMKDVLAQLSSNESVVLFWKTECETLSPSKQKRVLLATWTFFWQPWEVYDTSLLCICSSLYYQATNKSLHSKITFNSSVEANFFISMKWEKSERKLHISNYDRRYTEASKWSCETSKKLERHQSEW